MTVKQWLWWTFAACTVIKRLHITDRTLRARFESVSRHNSLKTKLTVNSSLIFKKITLIFFNHYRRYLFQLTIVYAYSAYFIYTRSGVSGVWLNEAYKSGREWPKINEMILVDGQSGRVRLSRGEVKARGGYLTKVSQTSKQYFTDTLMRIFYFTTTCNATNKKLK